MPHSKRKGRRTLQKYFLRQWLVFDAWLRLVGCLPCLLRIFLPWHAFLDGLEWTLGIKNTWNADLAWLRGPSLSALACPFFFVLVLGLAWLSFLVPQAA